MSLKVPLWLDCDPGHDDAVAILLAAHHRSLDLLGVSTVYGNAPLSSTTENALSVLQAIGKSNISVFPGRQNPFSRPAKHAPGIHGESGLDGTDLLPKPDRLPLTHCNAIKEMKDALLVTPKNTAWLVATGTLTNIALLFAVFPEVATHIKGLSIMGGAVGDGYTDVYMGPEYTDLHGKTNSRIGNMTPFAEFNIWCDSDSAKSIFSNPDLKSKTSLITLDLSHQVLATKEVREMLLHGSSKRESPTKLRQMFCDLLVFFAKTYEEVFGLKDGPPLHDPLAVAILLMGLNENLFDDEGHERYEVRVVTEGEQDGRTEVSRVAEGVFIPRSVDTKRFWDIIEDCLEAADKATGYYPFMPISIQTSSDNIALVNEPLARPLGLLLGSVLDIWASPVEHEKITVSGTGSRKCCALEKVLASAIGVNVPDISITFA